MEVRDRVALVTGGGAGIGRAVAVRLAREGASVVVSDIDEEAGSGTIHEIESADGKGSFFRADVASEADARGMVAFAEEEFGGLDVLVNNAGVGVGASVVDTSDEEWRRILDTNLTGVFYCCRAAIPHLRARGGGWIVNVSSLASRNPFAGGAVYSASKAGLNAFSEALMQEVRHDGIRVSAVLPGSVATEFSGRGAMSGADWRLQAEDVAEVIVDLLAHPPRSLPSLVEIRPSRPVKA
jgi:NAD(P)-dependent dehydrogenase (short-subunit alcohol dehydrogenase family)